MCWSCHHAERSCTAVSIYEGCWADYLADPNADPFEPGAPRGVSVQREGSATRRCTSAFVGPVLRPLAKPETCARRAA